jgi:hypothetical protein
MLRTTKPPTVVIFALAAALVVSVGYIITLAILAPQQLAEATTAAIDLICDQCVGTSDIADGAVTSAKIGSGQIRNSDMGSSAVTSNKIADGTVTGADIASNTVGLADIANNAVQSGKIVDGGIFAQDIGTNAVTSSDISDTNGVQSVDIVDGTITSTDITNDAIHPNVHRVSGPTTIIASGQVGDSSVDCPSGEILTGGGAYGGTGVQVSKNYPYDSNTWYVQGSNESAGDRGLTAYVLCIGPSP